MTWTIDWPASLELRRPPDAAAIKKAVKAAQQLPSAGDPGHVAAPWKVSGDIPVIKDGAWKQATQDTVKLKKLTATTVRLKRDDLIWHIQNPGKSRFRGTYNTHIQVADTGDDQLIIDGHHRAAALLMLGVKKDMAWLLKT